MEEENSQISTDTEDIRKPEIAASQQALKFLSGVDNSEWQSLLFSDVLVIVSESGKEIGEMKISVEEASWHDEDCFMVHANSNGIVDQFEIGTSVIAYISKSLKTLEQTQHEYMKIKDHPLDKKTQIIAEGNGYTVKRTISQGEEVRKSSSSVPSEGFISEGSNLLLQRLLTRQNAGLSEDMIFVTLDSDSNLCTSTYRSLGTKAQTIGREEINVIGIERAIYPADEEPTLWRSFYLPNGHLTSRTQLGSQVTMTVVGLPPDQEEKKESSKAGASPRPRPLKWEEDMQLYSRFLDRKAELGDDHATYMRRHPELRALLADFLQFLLLRKPDDVCDFASEFFAAFSTAAPSAPSFAQSSSTSRPTSSTHP